MTKNERKGRKARDPALALRPGKCLSTELGLGVGLGVFTMALET